MYLNQYAYISQRIRAVLKKAQQCVNIGASRPKSQLTSDRMSGRNSRSSWVAAVFSGSQPDQCSGQVVGRRLRAVHARHHQARSPSGSVPTPPVSPNREPSRYPTVGQNCQRRYHWVPREACSERQSSHRAQQMLPWGGGAGAAPWRRPSGVGAARSRGAAPSCRRAASDTDRPGSHLVAVRVNNRKPDTGPGIPPPGTLAGLPTESSTSY